MMLNKTCPKCGSGDYAFRSRKKIPSEPGQEGPEQVETKYRCKTCEHEWRVRVAADPTH
jgi:transposase-like protein